MLLFYQNAFTLLLALALLSLGASSHANDFAVYECKSDLGSRLAAEMEAEIAGEDSELASSMKAFTAHNIYKFDYVNKTVTYRLLNNKGEEFGLLGLGQVSKYTTEIQLDGNNITWNQVIIDSDEGLILANYTFNLKSGKLHVVTTIKPTAVETPEPIDEDNTCTPYSLKKN